MNTIVTNISAVTVNTTISTIFITTIINTLATELLLALPVSAVNKHARVHATL